MSEESEAEDNDMNGEEEGGVFACAHIHREWGAGVRVQVSE